MKIGIIYHSQSGTTRKLAQHLQTALTQQGHEITMTELKTDVEQKGGTIRQPMNFTVTNLPDVSAYDALCIGGPVWAFGPSTVTFKAIQQLADLKGKKVLPFCTMGFPLKGMGGKGCIRHFSALLKEKGAEVLPGVIVSKMFHNLEQEIGKAVRQSLEQIKG
jgi:flavodoxin